MNKINLKYCGIRNQEQVIETTKERAKDLVGTGDWTYIKEKGLTSKFKDSVCLTLGSLLFVGVGFMSGVFLDFCNYSKRIEGTKWLSEDKKRFGDYTSYYLKNFGLNKSGLDIAEKYVEKVTKQGE